LTDGSGIIGQGGMTSGSQMAAVVLQGEARLLIGCGIQPLINGLGTKV